MNEKTALTRRIAAAVRSALTPRRLRYLGTAILAVLAVIAGTSTVSAMSAPVPQRLVIDERAQAQIQRDQALFQAWAIDRSRTRGCLSTGCRNDGEPHTWLEPPDERYARVAFRADLAPALADVPSDIAASLPPMESWGDLRRQLRDRATTYREELTRQEKEIDALRYPNRNADNDPWGLPDMGGVSGSCGFYGCTVEEEVERADKWFEDRYTFADIPAWEQVEKVGQNPESLAQFIRERYDGGSFYAAAYTLPDEGANEEAVALHGLLFSVLATAALFLALSARRPQ